MQSLAVKGIQPEEIESIWPQAAAQLRRSLEPKNSLDYLKNCLLKAEAQLFFYAPNNWVVTRISQHCHEKTLHIWILAGEIFENDYAQVLRLLEQWAISQDCNAVEFVGRIGWKKTLLDYQAKHHLYRKVL